MSSCHRIYMLADLSLMVISDQRNQPPALVSIHDGKCISRVPCRRYAHVGGQRMSGVVTGWGNTFVKTLICYRLSSNAVTPDSKEP